MEAIGATGQAMQVLPVLLCLFIYGTMGGTLIVLGWVTAREAILARMKKVN